MSQLPARPPPTASAPTIGAATNGSIFVDAPFHRALLVANPISGRGQGESVATELAAGLRERGVACDIHVTQGRGDARARLRCIEPDNVDLVVSIGGDGTLREVFSGLLDPRIPVGVIPLGTANVLSLDLGLPRDVDGALEILCAKKTVAIDVFDVNGQLAFLVAGAGFDGDAVHEVEAHRKGPITKWSYVSAGLRALRKYREPALEVELDGRPLLGTYGWVIVSNMIHYAGCMRLSTDRVLDDGLLEVYLFRRADRRHLLAHGVRGLTGRLPGGGCELVRARRVAIRSPEPVACQVDGDARGTTPLEIEVTGQQFRVLVP